MKDGFDKERNKDWFWPWVLGAGILLVVGGIGLYLLRGRRRSPSPSSTCRQPVVDTPARAAAGRRRHGAAARRGRCRCRRSTRAIPTCSAA